MIASLSELLFFFLPSLPPALSLFLSEADSQCPLEDFPLTSHAHPSAVEPPLLVPESLLVRRTHHASRIGIWRGGGRGELGVGEAARNVSYSLILWFSFIFHRAWSRVGSSVGWLTIRFFPGRGHVLSLNIEQAENAWKLIPRQQSSTRDV